MPKQKDHIIIRMFPSVEGGVYYEIFNDDADIDLEEDDGGLCVDENEDPNKELTRKDYEKAFGMATSQALDLLFPQK